MTAMAIIKTCVICGGEFQARTSAVTCSKAHSREWKRELVRQWQTANRERQREWRREQYAANRERERERAREWRAANIEIVRERDRKRRRTEAAALVQRAREIILLDLMMPNGKAIASLHSRRPSADWWLGQRLDRPPQR
jgi:hypothetical protein